jgi:hypothetical protein
VPGMVIVIAGRTAPPLPGGQVIDVTPVPAEQ